MYSTSIEALIRRLSELMHQRRKLDAAIARAQTLVRTQADLSRGRSQQENRGISKTAQESIGFTEAIRLVLETYPVWLAPTSIRDLLPSVGFESNSSRNTLVSTHTVLKRLVRNSRADCKYCGSEALYKQTEPGGVKMSRSCVSYPNPSGGSAAVTTGTEDCQSKMG